MRPGMKPLRAPAGHTKQGMAERLAVAEDRLARVMREDVMRSLAEAKLQLAQADFDILELQVLPGCGHVVVYYQSFMDLSAMQCIEAAALTASGDADTGVART